MDRLTKCCSEVIGHLHLLGRMIFDLSSTPVGFRRHYGSLLRCPSLTKNSTRTYRTLDGIGKHDILYTTVEIKRGGEATRYGTACTCTRKHIMCTQRAPE